MNGRLPSHLATWHNLMLNPFSNRSEDRADLKMEEDMRVKSLNSGLLALVATAALGLGFGLTLGSLSTYAGAFHPQRREVALTALNVVSVGAYGLLARRRAIRSFRSNIRKL